MNNKTHRVILATIGMAAIAFALRLGLEGVLADKATFLPFFAVVIVASAIGGFWPGVLATILSIVGASLLLKLPGRPSLDSQQLALQMALFSGSGVLIAIVGESFIRAKRRLDGLSARLVAAEASRMLALESGRMGTWEWDRRSNKVEWAPTMGSVFGLETAEFPKTFEQYLALIHPEDRELVQQNLQEAVDQGQPQFDGRYRTQSATGQIRWIATRGTTHTQDGQVKGLSGVCWQVTEEVEVAMAQARLAAIVETSDDGIVSKDLEGTILTWNEGAAKIFGYSDEEVVGQSIQILLPPDRKHEESEILAKLRMGISIKNMETVRMRKDGRLIDVNLTISPIFDAQRKIIGVSKFVRDVTAERNLERARQAIQKELVDRERRLTLATDAANLGIVEWDIESDEVRWENRNMYEMFGRSVDKGPFGSDYFLNQVILEPDREAFRATMENAIATGEPFTGRFQIRRERDGLIRTLENVGIVAKDANGRAQKVIAVISDITDKLTAEEQLNVVLSKIEDQLVSFDTDWRYVYANDGACAMLGKRREELIDKVVWEVFPHAKGSEYYQRLQDAYESQTPSRFEHYYEEFNRWFENHIYPSPRGVTVFASDVTERKQSEQALEESRTLLAAHQRRLQQLIDSIPVLISFVDTESRYQLVNKQYENWFSVSAADVIGKHMQEVLGDRAYGTIRKYVERALSGEEVSYEMQIPYANAGSKFVKAHYIPSRSLSGELNGFFVLVADHTEVNIRELNARFLASASSTLAEVGDYRTTLKKIAELAVPLFADWCAIDLVNDLGLERLTVPDSVESFHSNDELSRARKSGRPGIWRVLQSGRSELEVDIPTSELSMRLGEPSHFQQAEAPHSYICVPLKVAGETLGTISMVVSGSRRAYRPEDLENAEDLARRASVMIENASLYERLQESDRRKDEFLATLAHELRNPLAPLRTGLDLLAVSVDRPESVSELHAIMERQTNQLIRLVDDLLDISRITTGKLELRKETVQIEDVIKHAVESNRMLLEERSQSLFVQALNEIPPVSVDPVRITQVIQNLLNNAAKYTDPGGTIQLTSQLVGSDLVIAVKDNGIGIDPAQLENVFGMFSQVQSALTRAQGGLGIGLALVKGLVQMHGGHVEVHSEGLGHGSEFIVKLPVTTVETGRSPSDQSTSEQPSAKKILVVDDNVDNANLLGKMLELAGNEVETANSGLEAIHKFRQFRPDVMFLDIGMPDMNGYEVAERILQGPNSEDVVLVALTGWGSDEDRRRTREAGFHHHLVKPVQMADLGKLLEATH